MNECRNGLRVETLTRVIARQLYRVVRVRVRALVAVRFSCQKAAAVAILLPERGVGQ